MSALAGASLSNSHAVDRSPAGILRAHMELTKVRLNAMVVFTTAVGYVVGSKMNAAPITENPNPHFNWYRLWWTCLGTFLAAAGASAFNQAAEARRDARMHRTRNRPLVTGQLTRTYAATFGLVVSILGVAILCPTSNGIAASLAAINVLLYIAIYTPLKPLTATNTLVGAIVGGIPPIIGWAAATGKIVPAALVRGALRFQGQIPHVRALAWMYKDDYARGGFKMIPNVEPTGRLTSRLAIIYTVLLIPVCLLLTWFQNAGTIFAAVAFTLTFGMLAVALRFALTRTREDARSLFLASILYLPLLTTTLMLDSHTPTGGYLHTEAGFVLVPSGDAPAIDPESPQGRELQSLAPESPALPAAESAAPPTPAPH